MDCIYELAKFCIETPYEDIPKKTIENAKKLVLDIIATITAGSTAAICPEVAAKFIDWGGKEESNVLVYSKRLPAPAAAMVNGTMAHARYFDDTHDNAVIHTGVSVIPTALAVAEANGNTSGKDFLKAVVMGVDVFTRLTYGAGLTVFQSGFMYTSLFAYFASAIAASIVDGHNTEQAVNTCGIVLSQASGILQTIMDSALTKRMQPGFAAQAASQAAFLTDIGVTGCKDVLEGPKGFYQVYFRGNYHRENILKNLGKTWYIDELAYKPYPCCRYTHSGIDGIKKIMREHNVNADNIVSIDVSTTEQVGFSVCNPIEKRRHPQCVVDAQFSIPFTMASAIINGNVDLSTFEEKNFDDEKILALTSKINPYIDEEIEKKYSGCAPTRVVVHTADGDFEDCVVIPKGSPENPMSIDEILEKLNGTKAYAAYPVKDGAFEEIVETVKKLEEYDNVKILMDKLHNAYKID